VQTRITKAATDDADILGGALPDLCGFRVICGLLLFQLPES
jgi:hypothetical protein